MYFVFSNLKHSVPKVLIASLCFGIALACGGGGSSSSTTSTTSNTQSVTGVVSDPAISGATVTVYKLDGSSLELSASSDSSGSFKIEGIPEGSLNGYKLVATGGTDVVTGEAFDGIELSAPLAMFSGDQKVISPLTSLVAAELGQNEDLIDDAIQKVKSKLGDVDLTKDPTTDSTLQELALGITLLRKLGSSFSDIQSKLDTNQGLDKTDVMSMFSDEEQKSKAELLWDNFQDSGEGGELTDRYKRTRIKKKIIETVDGLSIKDISDKSTLKTNLKEMTDYLEQMNQSRESIKDNFIVEVITQTNSKLTKADLLKDGFDVTQIPAISSDVNLSFDTTLKKAFYTVPNSETNNNQLVSYDSDTDKSTTVKTDVITSNKTFVFRGIKVGNKTIIKERKFGIYLDPSQSKETRTGTNRSGSYEYNFYTNNAVKKFSITKPSDESVLFASANLPSQLRTAGIDKIGPSFDLSNTLADSDSSYLQLTAYEQLADSVKGEVAADKYNAPVVVNVKTAVSIQGKLVHIIEGSTGKATKLLVSYLAIHNNKEYPKSGLDATTEKKRLIICNPDLSGVTDVVSNDGLADGEFRSIGENENYVYLVRVGETSILAFHKTSFTLTVVAGASLPAGYQEGVHFTSVGGHDGNAVLSDFSSLPGTQHFLSDGKSAYVAINYDLDTKDAVGKIYFSPTFGLSQKCFKHALILKLTDTTGQKLYDNGDGIDHGDHSDSESPVGQINLIAVSHDKLIFELGNFKVGSNTFGHTDALSFSIKYGYVDVTSTTTKNDFGTLLKEKTGLSYFTARRIYPLALGPYLYLNLYDSTVDSKKVFKVYKYNLSSLASPVESTGRQYFIKKAVRPNGVYDGTVITWNHATAKITDIVNGAVVGNVDTVSNATLTNVFTNDQPPVSGQGVIGGLSGDKGDHSFILVGFKAGQSDSLKLVYGQTGASWLIE